TGQARVPGRRIPSCACGTRTPPASGPPSLGSSPRDLSGVVRTVPGGAATREVISGVVRTLRGGPDTPGWPGRRRRPGRAATRGIVRLLDGIGSSPDSAQEDARRPGTISGGPDAGGVRVAQRHEG